VTRAHLPIRWNGENANFDAVKFHAWFEGSTDSPRRISGYRAGRLNCGPAGKDQAVFKTKTTTYNTKRSNKSTIIPPRFRKPGEARNVEGLWV
jgi:hypothetical protein